VAAHARWIFDADVHIHENYQDLAPYFEMPWRRALEGSPAERSGRNAGGERFLDAPGYSPLTPYDPILNELPESEPHKVTSPEVLRADLDARGVAAGLIFTGRLLHAAVSNDYLYAAALGRAYNRYLAERWVDPTKGIYAAIMAANQVPEEAAQEIETYAKTEGFAAVYLPNAGTYPHWGDRSYRPIFAAAQNADLPVVLHGAVTIYTVFPYQLHHMPTALAKQTLSQSFAAQANLVHMLTSGILAEFPRLRVVIADSGISWLPHVMGRLDHFYPYLREEVPHLEAPPSEYIRQQIYVTTHPLDAPGGSKLLAALLETIGIEHIVFGSDWPHFDATTVEAVDEIPLTEAAKRDVLGENARRIFRLE
jgi:predicted TIM-barrel fold metal-dependent hydrolase